MTTIWVHGYFFGWLFWTNVGIGALAWLAMHHLTRGDWGRELVPAAAAASRALLVLVPLAAPWLLQAAVLFPWADPFKVSTETILQHRLPLYEPMWVEARLGISFLLWMGFAAFLGARGRKQGLAAACLLLQLYVVTFFAFDWVASLEPKFYSSIYGFLILLSQALSGLAVLVCVCAHPGQKPGRCHDWGGLLLAPLMLLNYLEFCQLVIMWSGNKPEEMHWLHPRVWGAWQPLGTLLFWGFGVLPFLSLLMGPWKRRPAFLRGIGAWLTLGSMLHLYWLVWPAFSRETLQFSPWALFGVVVVGALWGVAFWFFRGRGGYDV